MDERTFMTLNEYIYEHSYVGYRNKKNGKMYTIHGVMINATNANDGQVMIVYSPKQQSNLTFCREYKEFFQKFEAEDSVSHLELDNVISITVQAAM